MITGLAISLSSCDQKTYRLEYNLEESQSYKQHVQRVLETITGEEGKQVVINADSRREMTYLVKSVDTNFITMELSYDKMRSIDVFDNTAFGSPEKIKIDSDNPLPEPTLAPLHPGVIYEAIEGIPLEIVMNRNGEVQSVSGTDKFSEAIMNTLDTDDLVLQPNQSIADMASSLLKKYDEESIKQQLEQVLAYFPEKEVAVGETWNVNLDFYESFPITTDIEMKLVSVRGNIATIEGSGTASTPGEILAEQPHGAQLLTSLVGSQTCILKIDLETGLAVDGEIVVEMKGVSESKKVSVVNDEEPVTKSTMIPISLKSTLTITN